MIRDQLNYLFEKYGVSAYKVCADTGISQATLGRLLNGTTQRPNYKNIEVLSKYFHVDEDWLLTGKGEMRRLVIDALPIVSPTVMMVPLVSQYAYAGFQCGFADEGYIGSLPTMPFLSDHMGQGTYIAIEVKGDSMDDGTREGFVEGDVLLCREVPNHLWHDSKLHIKKWNFVILTDEGILLKRIIEHDVEQLRITIHSLNPFYPDAEIDLRTVRKIYNVVMSQRKERLR